MKYQSSKKVQRFEVKYSTFSKKQGYSYIYFISYSNWEKTDKRCMKVKCAVRIRFAIAFRGLVVKGTDRHSEAGSGGWVSFPRASGLWRARPSQTRYFANLNKGVLAEVSM